MLFKKQNLIYLLQLFIVFLGVTMAFVLNKWNENKRESIEEKEYLSLFYEELNGVNKGFIKIKNYNKHKLYQTDQLIKFLETKESLDSINVLTSVVLLNNMFINPNSNTWESIKTSGELKLITDMNLKILLTRLYFSYAGIEEQEQIFVKFLQDNVTLFTLKNWDLKRKVFLNNRMAYDPYFQNLVYFFKGKFVDYNNQVVLSDSIRNEVLIYFKNNIDLSE